MSEATESKTTDAYAGEDEELPAGIAENHDRKIPIFLKLTYIGFTTFALIYLFMYWRGDGSPLVQLLNQATGH